jgi:hypothetical protein
MPNDYNSDTFQEAFARLAVSIAANGDQLKKLCQDIKPTTSCRPCLDINDQSVSAHASPASTEADKQTQKRPCEPAVEYTLGSSKRPFTYDKAAAADASPVVSSETVSDTHGLDNRDEDIVLEEIQSYPEANTDSCHYVSTANQHIFHDRNAFETYQSGYSIGGLGLGSSQAQTCAKGVCRNRPYVSGRGTVRVEGRYGDRASSIRLTDVLHVSQAESNIISGVQLDKAGVTATLGNGHVTLSFQGANIVDGEICDELYRLNMRVIRPSSRPPAALQPLAGIFGGTTFGTTLVDGTHRR